jgi:hypothetical protein
MEETPLEGIPALGSPKRPVNKRFVYLILIVLVILVAFFSYRIFWAKGKAAISQNPAVTAPSPTESFPTDTPTPTLAPNITITPTAVPTLNPVDQASGLDRSKLSVTVENGSGGAGVAGKGAAVLTHLGYNVTGTGNADNFDFTNVVIQVKSASNSYLGLLQNDLGLTYTIGSTSADLPDSFSTDALVIIGK